MDYYMAATGGKGEFQHHVVIGVGKEWPPQEMDFLQKRRRAPRRRVFRPRQDLLLSQRLAQPAGIVLGDR
jgi:hypothetical protein